MVVIFKTISPFNYTVIISMKKLLALFTLCLAFTSAYAHPQDGMTPEDLMHYFIKVFNDENIPALEEVYHFPHVKIVNGKLFHFDEKDAPIFDESVIVSTSSKKLELI